MAFQLILKVIKRGGSGPTVAHHSVARVGPVVRTAPIASPTGVGHEIIVVARIHRHGEHDLLGVVEIDGVLRFVLRFRESREEHARQNRNNRDHNEQLNERERRLFLEMNSRNHGQ